MWFGVSNYPFPDNGYGCPCSRGRVAWIDPDQMMACNYSYTNPNPYYDFYTVEVYQDGVLMPAVDGVDLNHYSMFGPFADNINRAVSGDFHYFYPIIDGHPYSARVGKNCKGGTVIAWSAIMSFSTGVVPAKVPTTVNILGGKAPKKK